MSRMDDPATAADSNAEQEFQQHLTAATPRAFVTPSLMAINVVVFVVMAVLGMKVFPAFPTTII